MLNLKTERTLCSILIAGKTGAGKSVLLNAMFGEKARANVGKPVTADIVRYDMYPTHLLTVFDTPGLRTFRETNLEIQQHIHGLIKHLSKRSDQRIHAVWYCISARGKRIEDSEITWIHKLADEGIAVILVLTQFLRKADDDLLTYVEKMDLPVCEIVPVLAAPFEIPGGIIVRSHGLDQLAHATARVLPEAARTVFIKAQLADQELKRSPHTEADCD
ncbi:MAG: GTPase [Elainellaceae cyanobacterium]